MMLSIFSPIVKRTSSAPEGVLPAGSVHSTRWTPTVPMGIGAPVMILTTFPDETAAALRRPAATASTTS